MPVGVRMTVDRPKKGLDDVGKAVERSIRASVEDIVHEVERRAKVLAPVDTGRLRASIEGGMDEEGGLVKAQTEYAAFMEFGTGQVGRLTDPGPTPSWYTHGPSPGQEAQPFLRPAVQEVAGRVGDIVARHLKEDLR